MPKKGRFGTCSHQDDDSVFDRSYLKFAEALYGQRQTAPKLKRLCFVAAKAGGKHILTICWHHITLFLIFLKVAVLK